MRVTAPFNTTIPQTRPVKEATGATYMGAVALGSCIVVVALVVLNDISVAMCR